LGESICFSHKLYEPLLKVPTDPRHILRQILEFIAARIKPVLLEKEVRYDVVDAVLSSYNDILDVFEKASSINQMLNHPAFPGVVLSADRIWRIAKETPRENIIETDFVQEEEKKLYEIYMKVNWEVGEAVNKEKWGEAVVALAQLTSPLEIFFDKVMVMHKQENLKLNRLALLKAIEKVYLRVADFKKVVLS
jgi:glycyl-tRNA synthetase beta chain